MKKTFFTVFQQMRDSYNIALGDINLLSDLGCGVASVLQAIDFAEQFQWADLAPGDVFDQTHQEAFFPRCFLNNGWNLNLAEHHEGLKATLAAYQIVRFAICGFDPTSYGNGPLETKTGNIGHDALESGFVPASWIED